MTLPFSRWVEDEKHFIESEQVQEGYAWLRQHLDDLERSTFEGLVSDEIDLREWYSSKGTKGAKEAFTAYWQEADGGYRALHVGYNRFSGGGHWVGHKTVSDLYNESKLGVRRERPKVYTSHQQKQQAQRNAAKRAKAAKVQRALQTALAEYQARPEAQSLGKYFTEKGFQDTAPLGLKRGYHDKHGSYDVLPVQHVATSKLTSLAKFFDTPFERQRDNGQVEMERKLFETGGVIKGSAVFLDGLPSENFTGVFRVSEGVATDLTVRQATGGTGVYHVAALFAGNLEAVCSALAQRWPDATVELVLDNDWQKALEVDRRTGKQKPNTGLEKGHDVARRLGLGVYQPDFSALQNAEGSLSDFNDLMRVAGLEEVRRQLVLRDPPPGGDHSLHAKATEKPNLKSESAPDEPPPPTWDDPEAQAFSEGLPELQDLLDDREEQRQAYLAKRLKDAHEVQRTSATSGVSAYFERKSVAALFETHEVPKALLDDKPVPGMVYGNDEKRGPFVQLAACTLEGTVTGYQRIYDDKTLPGGRDTEFIGQVGGAFVLLRPKGVPLPRDGSALAKRLTEGREVGVSVDIATGASIALARPKAFVLCALSSDNLEFVLAALRRRYGYTRLLGEGRKRRKALDLFIWGDNDEDGAGQRAAHLAAFKAEAHVFLPSEPGTFSDLYQSRGKKAIRRAEEMPIDLELVFADKLAEQTLSLTKHLPPFDLPPPGTARIVRSPQETGKTHQLAAALAKQPDLRVLVVVHRIPLAKNMARRLAGFKLYSDVPAHLLHKVDRLVITFDSLFKLLLNDTLPFYDLVVIDECEQVLEHTTGRHIGHKADNNAALEGLLCHVPRIVVLDADAGPLTENELRRTNPARRIEHLTHDYRVATGRHLDLVRERDDALDALEAETRPAYYTTDSLRHARDLSEYLNDPKTLVVSSETSGEGDAAAYLLNPKEEAEKYQRLIGTPSNGTGFDDTSGHWEHVFGSFGGRTSAPQDAVQAIFRARGVQQVTAHVPRGRGTAVSVSDALKGAADLEVYEAEALGEVAETRTPTNYERRRAEVVAQRSARQANYRSEFALKAALLGFRVTCHLPVDLSADQLEKRQARRDTLKAKGLARYVEDRASAERIDADAAKLLEEAHSLTREQTFALEQQQLRSFYVLPDDVSDAELRRMLEQDDYGDFRTLVKNYDAMLEPCAEAEKRSREKNTDRIEGDKSGEILRHVFHQHLALVIGLDADTEARADDWQARACERQDHQDALQAERAEATNHRKGAIDKQLAALEREATAASGSTLPTRYDAENEHVQAWVEWCRTNYKALKSGGILTCPIEHLTDKPLEVIGDSLRRAGVIQVSDGKRKQRTYAAALTSISTMRNFSRPRRKNWDFTQQTINKKSCKLLLRKNEESTSCTAKVSIAENLKEMTPEVDPTVYVANLLSEGKLKAFGPSELALITRKVDERDGVWLGQLARSRDLGQVLGFAGPRTCNSAPQAVA